MLYWIIKLILKYKLTMIVSLIFVFIKRINLFKHFLEFSHTCSYKPSSKIFVYLFYFIFFSKFKLNVYSKNEIIWFIRISVIKFNCNKTEDPNAVSFYIVFFSEYSNYGPCKSQGFGYFYCCSHFYLENSDTDSIQIIIGLIKGWGRVLKVHNSGRSNSVEIRLQSGMPALPAAGASQHRL